MELYIHIPFCVRKCRYCDFLSAPPSCADEPGRYADQLVRELSAAGGRIAEEKPGRTVTSVYLGGGTPSLLPAESTEKILGAVREHFSVTEDAEITMEVNPGTADREKLGALRSLGVNRLSIGLQSVHGDELRLLGRIHSYKDFLRCYDGARAAGFANVSVDLISALPGQDAGRFAESMRRVMALRPEHVSVYSLIVEPGTPFYGEYGANASDLEHYGTYPAMPARLSAAYREKAAAGALLLPDEDTERAIYHMTGEMLAGAGYGRYEISNYALAGFESRHNTGYWTGEEYLGAGLGSASFLGGSRFSVTRSLADYLAFTEEDLRRGRQYGERQVLTKRESMEEFMFLGLRLLRGVSTEEFRKRFDIPFEDVYNDTAERLCADGLLRRARDARPGHEGLIYSLTERGLDVASAVMAEFLLS